VVAGIEQIADFVSDTMDYLRQHRTGEMNSPFAKSDAFLSTPEGQLPGLPAQAVC